MTRRELLPVTLILLVTVADAAHAPTVSFYFLLAAVPALVVVGLTTLEDVLSGDCPPARRVAGLVQAAALGLVVLAAAIRAPLRAEGTVPAVAVSAVVACLVLFAFQALVAGLPSIRRSLRRERTSAPAPLSLER